ncbi:MAG: lipopolysaccharide biosynthesis protein [Porphyromonas sp.]
MSQNTQIAKNTLFLYIRMALIMGVSLYTSRVILAALGETDFGIYSVVGGMALMFAFFSSSLSNATQRFLNIAQGKGEKEEASRVFALSQISFFFLSLIVLLFAEVIGLWFIYNKLIIPVDRVDAALWVFHATIISLFFTINGIVFNSVLVARENFRVYAYIGVFEAFSKLAIAAVLSWVDIDRLKLYASLYVAMTITVQIFYAIYCIYKYEECRVRLYWDKKMFVQLSSFIGWNTFGTAVWALNGQGLSMLMNTFFGVSVNAARGISSQVEQAVNNFNTGFITATKPQVIKLFASGDHRSLVKLTFDSSRLSFFLMLALSLPIIFQREFILSIWLSYPPSMTASFVVWALIFSLVNSLTNPLWNAMQAVGELRRYTIVGGVVYSLVFPISYVGLLCYPNPVLPLIILVLIRFIYVFVALTILKGYIQLSISDYILMVIKPILYVVFFAGVGNYLLCTLYAPDGIVSLILFSCLNLSITLACTYIFGLKVDERIWIKKKIKSLICR